MSSFEKKWEELAERIVQGISSPYGEGATYNHLDYTPDEKVSHLDEDEMELMKQDLRELVTLGAQEALQRVEKVIGDRLRLPVDDVMELQEELLAKLREEYK